MPLPSCPQSPPLSILRPPASGLRAPGSGQAHFLPCLMGGLLGGHPQPLPLLQEPLEVLLSSERMGGRSSGPPHRSSGGSLPSWPECCRCSWRSHPNTLSFELPFFFPFCRDFMAVAPGPRPSHLCPSVSWDLGSTGPPWDPRPASGLGLAPGGQGSKPGVEGGLAMGSGSCPRALATRKCPRKRKLPGPWREAASRGPTWHCPARPAQALGGPGSCAAPQTRFLLEHLCNHRGRGGGGS